MSNFHLKDDFRPGGPASQVPASWFNKVANFLNNLIPGRGIKLTKSERGASVIECTVEGGGGADLSGVGPNKIVGTDAGSEATAAASMPTQNANNVQVLGVAKKATALSWLTASLVPENTTSKTNLANAAPGTATANSSSWTYGGTNGASLRVQTRTMWNGTYLYGFYRDIALDRFGRVYSIGAETRFTIDTPVTYNP